MKSLCSSSTFADNAKCEFVCLQAAVQEPSLIVSGLAASVEGVMGTDLSESTAVIQGVEADKDGATVPEGTVADASIEVSSAVTHRN